MRALAVVVVVAIIVIAVTAGSERSRCGDALSGVWVGDPTFLKKADLADMQLYIAPDAGQTRDGYLIMTNAAGEFVANQAVDVEYSFGAFPLGAARLFNSALRRTPTHGTLQISGGTLPLPDEMRFALSSADSSLTLFGEKLFAFLYKDPVATAAARHKLAE
ncbi:MAG: hypothetical protein KGL39_01665 [Patescibacteria group bacterium]|nr:hypothetical protein [Patescibacteria group bacterium]